MLKEQLLRQYLDFWRIDEPELPDRLLFFGHVASIGSTGVIEASALGDVAKGAIGRAMSFAESHYAQFTHSIGGSE